jgi:hypothetical protein
MAQEQLVTAVFRDRQDAEQALDYLHACGHTRGTIRVMTSDHGPALGTPAAAPRPRRGNRALEGMAVGGLTAMLLGAIVCAWLAVGTSLAVPGLRMVVAGPIVAGLVGAGIGAVVGQFLGLIVGLLVPARTADEAAFGQALAVGGTVLGVRPHNPEEAAQISDRFRQLNGESVSSVSC